MYSTGRPIVWYDANRVSPADARRLRESYEGFVVAVNGYQHMSPPPIGVIGEPYPTPTQLFRWTPPRCIQCGEVIEQHGWKSFCGEVCRDAWTGTEHLAKPGQVYVVVPKDI